MISALLHIKTGQEKTKPLQKNLKRPLMSISSYNFMTVLVSVVLPETIFTK